MRKEIFEFLGLKRNIIILLGAIVVTATGERLWLGFAPKYLEVLGGGIFLIGLFDGLQTILGALYAYPGAWLTDRFGQKKSFLLFTLLSIVGYLIISLWPHRFALIIGSFFFLAWSSLSLPATFSMVATQLKKEKQTMGIGVQSLIRRIPMMSGPLIGGQLIAHFGWTEGVRYALLICIALSVLTFFLQLFMIDDIDDSKNNSAPDLINTNTLKKKKELGFFDTFKAFPASLKELLVSDVLIRFCERIPYAFIILWVIDNNNFGAQDFGYLVAIEMVVAMLCYIPVAHLADKYGKRPFVLITFIFFTLFPLVLMFSHSFYALMIAFAIRGLKEFGEPARKALIIAYAPSELKAKAYGVYYLIRDCIVTIGSFLGAILWKVSPQVNFSGAAICGLLGTVWFYFYVYKNQL